MAPPGLHVLSQAKWHDSVMSGGNWVVQRDWLRCRPDAQRMLDELLAERERLDREIEALKRLTDAMADLAQLDERPEQLDSQPSDADTLTVPSPRVAAGTGPTVSDDQAIPGDRAVARPDTGARPGYRRQVSALLAQDPQRWWKARELGDALAVRNLRSFREAVRDMAQRGLIEKESDPLYGTRYRALNYAPAAGGEAVIA